MTLLPGETVQSQYANSSTIFKIIESYRVRISPDVDIKLFYKEVFDIETCRGSSLDTWGRILGIGREMEIDSSTNSFGFEGTGYEPFDTAPFYAGEAATALYSLADEPYRTLLLWKALTNISTADAATLNHLLSRLFPGKEIVVRETGIMAIELYIYFPLEPWQRAILKSYGLMGKGAGVELKWTEIPVPVFGFYEAGYEPFNTWPFWQSVGE